MKRHGGSVKIRDDLNTAHPLTFLLGYNSSPISFQLDIPFQRIRAWGGRAVEKEVHPLYDVIHDYFVDGKNSYHKSALELFAQKHDPLDASEALILSREKSPGFARLSPLMAIYPWEAGKPQDRERIYINTLKRELRIRHLAGEDLALHRTRRGIAEFHRLISLAHSIQNHGFDTNRRGYTHIAGDLLVDERLNWCVLIRHGEHRVAALKFFGAKTVPVILSPTRIIRKQEHPFWPQVVSQALLPCGALEIFDRIMEGHDDVPLVNVVGWP